MTKTPQQIQREKQRLQRRKVRQAARAQQILIDKNRKEHQDKQDVLLKKQDARKKQAAIQKRRADRQRQRDRPTSANAKNLGWKPDADVIEKYNKVVYIIGGGPSLEYFNWTLLNESKFIVGINRAYEVCPTAQVNYFTDDDWYTLHKKQGFLEHSGVKIKGSLNPSRFANDANIRQMHLTGEKGFETAENKLKHGRNSPYAAINMVVKWGFKKIYLLGIDLSYGRNDPTNKKKKKKTHWHSGHKRVDGEGTYNSFATNYKALPALIKPHKVTIINVNSAFKLNVFPTETYEQHFGPTWTTQKP